MLMKLERKIAENLNYKYKRLLHKHKHKYRPVFLVIEVNYVRSRNGHCVFTDSTHPSVNRTSYHKVLHSPINHLKEFLPDNLSSVLY